MIQKAFHDEKESMGLERMFQKEGGGMEVQRAEKKYDPYEQVKVRHGKISALFNIKN